MKFTGHAVLPVLVGIAAASRCKPHPHSSSALSAAPTISSVPASSGFVSSAPASSSVPESSVLISSAPASSVLPSSSILSSSIPSSSLVPTCGGAQCLAAITAVPSIGDAFCSSWLSWTPATTVVTEVETVTSTLTNLETVTAVATLTTATVTQLSGTTTVFQKRQLPSADPAESIFSECDSASESVSSACSCHLAGSATSTVTVTETTTSTEIPEYTSTVTTTETTNVIQTVSAEATRIVAPQPIVNSGFESYLSTGNISPWTDTVSTTGGQVQIINGVNPCTAGPVCAGGQVVIRVFPPTGGGYTAIRQTFLARPNTSYMFSFLYRCLNYNAASSMSVWYAGRLVPNGNVMCISTPTGALFERPRVGPFTTDGTGVGEIEVRFHNNGAAPYLYFYADAFEASVVV